MDHLCGFTLMEHFVSARDLSRSRKFSFSLGSQLLTNRARTILVQRFFDSPPQKSVTFSPFCFPSQRNLHHFFKKKKKKKKKEEEEWLRNLFCLSDIKRQKWLWSISEAFCVVGKLWTFFAVQHVQEPKKKKESVGGEDVFEVTSVKYQRTEDTGSWVQTPLDFFF